MMADVEAMVERFSYHDDIYKWGRHILAKVSESAD